MHEALFVFDNTVLLKAVRTGNPRLVQRLFANPEFSHTLQNHSDDAKFDLLVKAISMHYEAITHLLCEQFPNNLFHRNEYGCTPLHYVRAHPFNQQNCIILRYLLGRPGIERSLETNNLANILFDFAETPSYSPVIQTILTHYLHHSTPEHNENNKRHLENYLVQVFGQYNLQDNVPVQPLHQYRVIAEVLFYYQKKFRHLDNLYKKLARNGTPQRLYKFILDLNPYLKQLILEDEQSQLIQARFRLKNHSVASEVLQLATQLWYRFDFEAKCLVLRHAFSYHLLVDRYKVQETSVEGDIKRISLIDQILDLPLELRLQIIDLFFEEFGMTEYAQQEMRDTITSTASKVLIPHTDEQINKAFHLLLKGINSCYTNPCIFTAEQIDGKTRLILTPAKLMMQDANTESNTIRAYLEEETVRQLKLFDTLNL